MQTLSHTFIVLQYVGLWRPVHWVRGWKSTIYDCYTRLMIFLLISGVLSEFIGLLQWLDDVESFANKSFIVLTMVAVCGKALNVLIGRNRIIQLTNVLQEDPCRPNNEEESAIQRKFDKIIRFNVLSYRGLTIFGVSAHALRSMVADIPRRTLPYDSWLPFEHEESLLGFSFAYVHQIVALLAGAVINIAFDTLVPGLMLQTCAQFNILKQRFIQMPQMLNDRTTDYQNEAEPNVFISKLESKLLSQRIIHHLQIFEFAKTSNDLFGLMILIQYAVSTLVLCASVYGLSKMGMFSPEFTSTIVYFACMLIQIFIFCLYGFDVTNESMEVCDAVYEMDWSSFNIKTKKSLLTIMVRTLRPLKFTSFHVITLDLDSFNKLLKLSYSAYNVLQQSGS